MYIPHFIFSFTGSSKKRNIQKQIYYKMQNSNQIIIIKNATKKKNLYARYRITGNFALLLARINVVIVVVGETSNNNKYLYFFVLVKNNSPNK